MMRHSRPLFACRLCRSDLKSAIHRDGIAAHDLAAELLGQGDGERRLAACRWANDHHQQRIARHQRHPQYMDLPTRTSRKIRMNSAMSTSPIVCWRREVIARDCSNGGLKRIRLAELRHPVRVVKEAEAKRKVLPAEVCRQRLEGIDGGYPAISSAVERDISRGAHDLHSADAAILRDDEVDGYFARLAQRRTRHL